MKLNIKIVSIRLKDICTYISPITNKMFLAKLFYRDSFTTASYSSTSCASVTSRATGSDDLLLEADVADEAAMRAALDSARTRFGRIDGVIHAAGVTAREIVINPIRLPAGKRPREAA